MKLTKLNKLVSAILISIVVLGVIGYKLNLVEKFQQVGIGKTIARIGKVFRKEGVSGLWNFAREKITEPYVDPDFSLKYSLYDKTTQPPIESSEARSNLAEYKVIPGANIDKLPRSQGSEIPHHSWHRSHSNEFSDKFSSADQINTRNVGRLEPAWSYGTGVDLGDPTRNGWTVESNPIIANGRLFIVSADDHLISIDAETGREIWRLSLPTPVARRGLVWDPANDFSKSRLFVPTGSGVYAVNPENGEIRRDFGDDGQVGDNVSLIAPVIVNGKLIVAFANALVEAYDAGTGKWLWKRSLFEKTDATAFRDGASPWSGMSADSSRSLVYISTGNPRPALVGTSRPGENRNSCSVVALEASSGKKVWAFQEVSHDLWDLDVPSSPVLTTITKDGKNIDVVATVTKLGNTLLLDRDFGNPVFDYRLKRAPVSTIPGEQTSPYQPALETPEPFAKLVFEETDVTDLSDIARSTVKHKIRGAKLGFFEPPVVGGKIVLFNLHGGAEWPGAAVDPHSGILYVPSNQVPWIIRADYMDVNATAQSGQTLSGDSLYQAKCSSCHKPDRRGSYEAEYFGDAYFPALTGITLLRNKETLISQSEFDANHSRVNIEQEISKHDLEILFDYFSRLDEKADRERSFSVRAFWQLLLDDQGFPGSKPPWGFLTAVNLNTGKNIWQVPFGKYKNLRRAGEPVTGQVNFGGAIVTAGGLVFATGTIDNKIRAFDATNGQELWAYELPAAGSAPPVTYTLNGTQYVVVVASGGLFHGFAGRSDKVIAFKLPTVSY